MAYRHVTTVCLAFLALLTVNAIVRAADRDGGTPLAVAVSKFNASNEEEREKRATALLTVHEVRAALVHERKHLSDETQQIAEDILSTGMLPPSVELRVMCRHFADGHATYVWNIQLFFDKGAANEKGNKRLGELLTIRKRYIATQLRTRQLKPIDQLVDKRNTPRGWEVVATIHRLMRGQKQIRESPTMYSWGMHEPRPANALCLIGLGYNWRYLRKSHAAVFRACNSGRVTIMTWSNLSTGLDDER